MIVARAPFRISFAGGGSDLPSFYRQGHGAVVSATIDKYIYVVIHPYFHNKIRIKYSRTEDVESIDDIQHPLVRECLRLLKLEKGMEIASFADVPAGTGMGSSSAFTVCLLHALHALRGKNVSAKKLAEDACHVEIEKAGEPIGKQDQYATAFGGLNHIRFNADETVEVTPVDCAQQTRDLLQRHLMLFYVGQERAASSILREQGQNMTSKDKFQRVAQMVELADEMRVALELGKVGDVGEILHRGWMLKSGLAGGISNEAIDLNYRLAREAGASGGKLLGAGGGGFMLLFCPPEKQDQVRGALGPLREMSFAMSSQGSQVIFDDQASAFIKTAIPTLAL